MLRGVVIVIYNQNENFEPNHRYTFFAEGWGLGIETWNDDMLY